MKYKLHLATRCEFRERYGATVRLAEAGIAPSEGTGVDSYDNALAETINGLYKAELIHRRAPWKTKVAVKLAPGMGIVVQPSTSPRTLGCIPPAEAEKNYYQQQA